MGQNDTKIKVVLPIKKACLVVTPNKPNNHTTQEYFTMNKTKSIQPKSENTSLIFTLLSLAGVTDNKDLSKSHSGQASRYLLAFFVPKFWLASQATQSQAQTTLTHFTGLNRHIMPALAKSYGGVTLQNIKAIGKYAGRFYVTESEPRHPMTFHSVVLTQNYIGVAING